MPEGMIESILPAVDVITRLKPAVERGKNKEYGDDVTIH